MKFLRLTSVLLCCALLPSLLVVPVSAVYADSYYSIPAPEVGQVDTDDYYTLPAVEDSPVTLLSAIAASADYSLQLSMIVNTLQQMNNQNTTIINGIQSANVWLGKLDTHGTNHTKLLLSISDKISGFATEGTLSSVNTYVKNLSDVYAGKMWDGGDKWYTLAEGFTLAFGNRKRDDGRWAYAVTTGTSADDATVYSYQWASIIGNMFASLTSLYSPYVGDGHTLLWYSKQLQEVLASEQDVAIRENQEANIDKAKDDFLSGQSSGSSVSSDDLGDLSGVGGTFKDLTNLNGQSSVSDFNSGLADANTAGQGWFSQSTKDSLDAVTPSTQAVSTFAADGFSVDVDTYNMGDFADNYAWLWGDSE